jgi:hopanoid C-3 methylase
VRADALSAFVMITRRARAAADDQPGGRVRSRARRRRGAIAWYAPRYHEPSRGTALYLAAYNLALLACLAVLAAGGMVTFLVAWETTSLACYLLILRHPRSDESARGAFWFLAPSEIGLPGQRARGREPGQVAQGHAPGLPGVRRGPQRLFRGRAGPYARRRRHRRRAQGRGGDRGPALLAAAPDRALTEVPGAVTADGPGRPPRMLHNLDGHLLARHLGGRRRKYFIGVMDPAASIEFTRGCPWDCSFCSAWTFYGRSYRRLSPEAAEDMARIREPGVFIVDDVAFIKAEEGDEIARQLERRKIRKQYYLETRCDVLLRNEEVFRRWRRLRLNYMFLGLEALDEEGLRAFRKRTTPKVNNKALEAARSMGLSVAINIIADPDWDEARFAYVREWAMSVPEIVNITVQTPYPGTETWFTESRRLTTLDYRLFDVQHAVLPTRLPLHRFYQELVKTQAVLARKHPGFAALAKTTGIAARQLLRGQTNFARMIWKFYKVYNADRQYSEHLRDARYLLPPPAERPAKAPDRKQLYVHVPTRRKS